jgi:hypothetical protein
MVVYVNTVPFASKSASKKNFFKNTFQLKKSPILPLDKPKKIDGG